MSKEERSEELALEEGGPSWQIWMRIGLAPAKAVPLGKRALLLAGLCWLPLLALSAMDGLARGDAVPVPFLGDFAVYTRFLFAIVLFVLADAAVAGRLREVIRQFRSARLIAPAALPAFDAALASARRTVSSTTAEGVMLALVYCLSFAIVQRELHDGVPSWHALVADGSEHLTAAGWWYALFSVPLFQFLFLRWLFRGLVWARLLAQVAGLELRLVATHPDRAGGLAFVALGQAGFAILILAVSGSLASVIADAVVYRAELLKSFYGVMGAFVAVAVLVVLAPPLAFTPKLARLKREALFAYGKLSSLHDAAFDEKWRDPAAEPEGLLGTPDPSSLADLATGYERALALRPIPFTIAAVAPIVVAAALPMIPLAATKVPLKDILLGLLKVVL